MSWHIILESKKSIDKVLLKYKNVYIKYKGETSCQTLKKSIN